MVGQGKRMNKRRFHMLTMRAMWAMFSPQALRIDFDSTTRRGNHDPHDPNHPRVTA
jgi:hypothetical protein